MGARHDWGAIERALKVEGMRVSDILKRFSVPQSTFYYRARTRGWPLPLARPQSGAAADPEIEMLKRLGRLALKRILVLEASGSFGPPAETQARAVEGVTKILERMDQIATSDAYRQTKQPEWTQEYRDRTREELARRVLKVLAECRGVSVEEVTAGVEARTASGS